MKTLTMKPRYAVIKHGYIHEDGEAAPNEHIAVFENKSNAIDFVNTDDSPSDYFVRLEVMDSIHGWVGVEETEIYF